MQNIFMQSIQVTSLSKEEPFLMSLKLTFETGETKHIKLQMDKFTYKHISKVVFPNYLKHGSDKSVCSIPIYPQNNNCQSEVDWIIWNLFGQTSRFSFLCSKEYKLFLNKLRKVESLEEFNEILVHKYELPELPKLSKLPKSSANSRSLLKSLPLTLFFIFSLFWASSTNLLGYQPSTSPINESKIVMADVAAIEYEPVVTTKVEAEEISVPVSNVAVSKEMISFLPEGQIALTFDDGPSSYTQDILAVLEEHGVPATFFFVGKNIERFPEAVVDAHNQGHGIGLHSYSHQVLRGLSSEKQEEDIDSCVQAIKPYVNEVFLFRPPYGMFDDYTKEILSAHNMSLVLWNRDPKDWSANSSQQIVNAVLKPSNASPSGGIYVLHENAMTLKALPEIIKAIKEKNLEFVVLGNDNNIHTEIATAPVDNMI